MDSENQAASLLANSSSTGSSPSLTLSPIENPPVVDDVVKTNALENYDKVRDKSSSNGSISSSNSGIDGVSYDDDDDEKEGGYFSGKEEFEEKELERPTKAVPDEKALEKGTAGVDGSEPSVGSPPFFTPKASMPVAVEAGDDDVKNVSQKAPVIGGEEVEGNGNLLLPKEAGVVEELVQNDSVDGHAVADLGPIDVSKESGIIEEPIENGYVASGAAPNSVPIDTGFSELILGEADKGFGSVEKPEQLLAELEVASAGSSVLISSYNSEQVKAETAAEPSVEEDTSAMETVDASEVAPAGTQANKDSELQLNAPVIGSIGPSDGPEQPSHVIENVVEGPVENGSVARDGAPDLVPIDGLGESQLIERGVTEDLGSVKKPEQLSRELEVVPTESEVLVSNDDGKQVKLDYTTTEGDIKFTIHEDSSVETADGVVHMSQPEVNVAEEVQTKKDSEVGLEQVEGSTVLAHGYDQTNYVTGNTGGSEMVAAEGGFDGDIETSANNNVGAGVGCDRDIGTSTNHNFEVPEPDSSVVTVVAGDGEDENSCVEAVVKSSADEKADIDAGGNGMHVTENEQKAEAIAEKEAGLDAKASESVAEAGSDGIELVSGSDNASLPKGFHMKLEAADEATDEEEDFEGSISEGETDGMIFGSSEAAKQFIDELERSGVGSHTAIDSSHDHPERIDGQIVTDSDEEVDTDGEGGGKELFDSAALAALLKAATSAGSDDGNITITSQDGSRLFSIERPAGLGSSARTFRPATRPSRPNLFPPSNLTRGGESEDNLSEDEKKKQEKAQALRVKFLRLVQRLGVSSDESVAAQVLYRLALVAGRQTGQNFSLDASKRTASQVEAEGKDDLDFPVNILILGKSGVGKSATINSIFGEDKASINAFEPATTVVKEISGMVNGVKIKVLDTPGLRPAVMEQAFNRKVLSSINKLAKKSPPDIVLYVDRLDTQTRDLNDLPLLRTITSSLGPSIWKNAIVTLTHAASAPPDGPSGSPLSYEVFVTQRSHVVQQCIGHAVGDLRMMSPSLMNPVSLVENHPSCRKNRDGQKVLPNGQTWKPQLLLLCYSMKILSEASSLSKPQDPFDHRKLFGFRVRSPPLPYMLSSMLQNRPHPKLSTDQGIENGDSDIDLEDLSDTEDEEEENEYDQLPPFKPLRKSQLAKLSREQRKAYFEEYDYRVKLLQKKQWKEELRRMREMKKKGKDAETDYGFNGEDDQDASPAPVSTPLPDMVLPPSFDSDSPAYRYRFLEPTSQFLARPVLDTHGWDHDCGYDGLNLEHALAILGQFPAAVTLQMTKDKKEFSIHFDSSVAAKHGENGSSMLGFDIQNIGKQLAYIVRGETKFKNLKRNKTAAGMSVTFLGENVATGFKVEDQIAWGKRWALVSSAGTVHCQSDAAYGANLELQRREIDYPVGQVQSTYGLSLIRWRGDWALGFNTMAQFSAGRSSKVAVRAGINNKLSGQITVRTSSSEHLALALTGIMPIASAIYKKIWPAVGENYSIY